MEENKINNQEDSLNDIIFKDEDKSSKTKKFLFTAIIVIVIAVVVVVIATSFSPKDEVTQNSENLDVFEDDQDPFFMDSPADVIEPSIEKEERVFNKDKLLEEANDSSNDSLQSEQSTSSETEQQQGGESLFQGNPTQEVSLSEPVVQQTAPIDRTPSVDKTELTSERKYYIQTGTFLKAHPNDKFLKKIEQLGFTPLVDMYIHNGQEIRRVLIGPFETRGDASETLQTIKESLVKDAYLLKTRLH